MVGGFSGRPARQFCAAVLLSAAAFYGLAPSAQALEVPGQEPGNNRSSSLETATMPADVGPVVDNTASQAAADALLQAKLQEASSPSPIVEPAPAPRAGVVQERGGASWYGPFFHGRRTANGERYNQNEMTAAHKTLPFGTLVRVRSEVTGKEIEVRINDRGPFVAGRVIDLSQAAAKALGMLQAGVKRVTLLLPPRLRPGEWIVDKKPAGTSGVQSAGAPVSAAQDSPSASAFTPVIK